MAYYRKSAPIEDIRFTLRHSRLSKEVRASYEALEAQAVAGLARSAVYRQYVLLQQRWRHEHNGR
jgi:hypothetical protein